MDITGEKSHYIIAEIGGNHMGDINIALEMIRTAAHFCNADIIKFQKRNPKELLSDEEYRAPHPNPAHSYGASYGEHREYLEFSLEQHRILAKACKENNVFYSSSVWDITSAKEIISLDPVYIKVPSACNTNFMLLKYLIDHYTGNIHLSLGMTTKREEEDILGFFVKNNRNKDLVIYSCVSGYPVQFKDLSLLEISRLKQAYGSDVKAIGFSGHHLGIAADIAALALGASYFERHFTLDRTWKGTDQAASLEPDGLRRLSRDIANVSKALTYKREEILDVEKVQRKKLKRERNG
jgi:N-acetylneuraminate synthase